MSMRLNNIIPADLPFLLQFAAIFWLTMDCSKSEIFCGHQGLLPTIDSSSTSDGNCTFTLNNYHLGSVRKLIAGAPYNVTVTCEVSPSKIIKAVDIRAIPEAAITFQQPGASSECQQSNVQSQSGSRNLSIVFGWRNTITNLSSCSSYSITYVSADGVSYQSTQEYCPTQDCVSYLSSESGYVQSPNYPGLYEDNLDCIYYIIPHQGKQLYLQFLNFDIEPMYEGRCFDSLTIDGSTQGAPSTHCGNFTHSELSTLFFTAVEYFTIIFRSDAKSRGKGFRALYYTMSESECNKNVSGLNGNVTSPLFPGSYYPNLHCTTRINVPENYTIRLQVTYMDIEESANCRHDSIRALTVGDEMQSHWFSCGSHLTNPRTLMFESSGSTVDVQFVSNNLKGGEGFSADWIAIQSCSSSTDTYQTNNGSLYSPNYPFSYPNNQDCSNVIRSNLSTYIVELRFHKLHTESVNSRAQRDEQCNLDYVEIHDGERLHRRCGDWQGRENQLYFRSIGNSIMVRFVSNKRVTAPGFEISWRAIFNGTTEIICPNSWQDAGKLCVQINKALSSWFNGKLACQEQGAELVSIRDEHMDEVLQAALKISAGHNLSRAFWIGANDRQFENDFYWVDGTRVLRANWFKGWPQTGYDVEQPSDDGFANEDCVEMRRTFHLPMKGEQSTKLFYWNDRNCEAKNGYICQMYKNEADRPTPIDLFPCQGDITLTDDSPSGVIYSPGYPTNYSDFLNCILYIRAPLGYRVEVEFESFLLEDSPNCTFDYVELSHMTLETTLSQGLRLCGDYSRKIKLLRHLSSSNEVTLTFHTDHNVVAGGFRGVARLVEAGTFCGDGSWLSVGNLCYSSFISSRVNQSDARTICENMAAGLIDPQSKEEKYFISQLLLSDNNGHDMIWFHHNQGVNCQTYSGSDYLDDFLTLHPRSCAGKAGFVCSKPSTEDGQGENETTTTDTHGEWHLNPNTNGAYENNIERMFHIFLPENFRIFITISLLDIEQQDNCLYDYLEISESKHPERRQLYCGKDVNDIFYHSLGSHVTLRFKSDYSIGGGGFALSWHGYNMSDCNMEYSSVEGSVGSLNSPVSYFDNMDCDIVITAQDGFKIVLELRTLDLAPSAIFNNCADYLDLDLGATSLERLCHVNNTENGLVTSLSTGNTLHIHFHSDSEGGGKGFKANFFQVPDKDARIQSSLVLNNKRHGILESVNLHAGHISRLDQTVYLEAHVGWVITVTIESLSILNSSTTEICDANFMEITDVILKNADSNINIPLCSVGYVNKPADKKPVFKSHLHKVAIRLKTGDIKPSERPGFTVLYEVWPDPDFFNKTKNVTNVSFPACAETPYSCYNQGTCVSATGGGFQCKCTGYYTGLLCHVTWCEVDRCVRGRCNLTNSYYMCICENGYYGNDCEMDSDSCRANLCRGHGKCVRESLSSVICECELGYTGQHCQTISNKPIMTPRSASQRLLEEPIWIGLIVILSLVLIFVIMFCVKRKCSKRLDSCCTRQKKVQKKDEQQHYQNGRIDYGLPSPSLPSLNSYVSREPSPLIFQRQPQIFVEEAEDEPALTPNEDIKDGVQKFFPGFTREVEVARTYDSLPGLSVVSSTYTEGGGFIGAVGGISSGSFVLDADQINKDTSYPTALSVLKLNSSEPPAPRPRLNRSYSSTPVQQRHVMKDITRPRSFEASTGRHFYPHIIISNDQKGPGQSSTDEMAVDPVWIEKEEAQPERKPRKTRDMYSLNVPSSSHSLAGEYFLEYDAKKRRRDFALKAHSAAAMYNTPNDDTSSVLSLGSSWNRSSSTESEQVRRSQLNKGARKAGRLGDRVYSDSGLGHQSSCESCHSKSKRNRVCQCRKCIKYDRRHHHTHHSGDRRHSTKSETAENFSDFGYSSQSIKKASSTESDRFPERSKSSDNREQSVRRTIRKHKPVAQCDSSNSEKEYKKPKRPSLRKAKSQDHDHHEHRTLKSRSPDCKHRSPECDYRHRQHKSPARDRYDRQQKQQISENDTAFDQLSTKNSKDERLRTNKRRGSNDMVLAVSQTDLVTHSTKEDLRSEGFNTSNKSESKDSLLSEIPDINILAPGIISTVSQNYGMLFDSTFPVVNITKLTSSDEDADYEEDMYLPTTDYLTIEDQDSAFCSANKSAQSPRSEMVQKPSERSNMFNDNPYTPSSRPHVRDSAYQTKENSTDKSNSKTTSSAPSPEIGWGLDMYEKTLSAWSNDRSDEKRVTGQLQLAAIKLAQLQRRASDKMSKGRRLRVPGHDGSLYSNDDLDGCLPLEICTHELSRRRSRKLRPLHTLHRESSLKEVTEENSPVVQEDAYQSAPESFIQDVTEKTVFSFAVNSDNIEMKEFV